MKTVPGQDGDPQGFSPGTVVIINDNAKVTGGADKIALTSAVELAKSGRTVYLLTAVGPVADELLHVRRLHVLCTDQFELLTDPNPARAAAQGLWNRTAERAAQHLFATLDPHDTVVHVHLWAKALSSSVVRAARVAGFTVIGTLHDYLIVCPTGTLFQHPLQRICTLRPMSPACIGSNCDARNYGHKLWRVARQGVQAHVGGLPKNLQAVITLSHLSESVLRPHLSAQTSVFRLSNFVDTPQAGPAPVAENQWVAFSGRLVPEKGPLLLAQAAETAQVTPLFLGSGPLDAEVQRRCPTAEITGWLSHRDTLERLRSARCLVLPSLWYEVQPLVILEALSLGLPCVVPDTSAAAEMIDDGITGLLFRGGDAEDLARQLERLKDDGLVTRLGLAAYDRYWQAPYTVARHLKGLLDIYRQLCPERSRPQVGTTESAYA